MKSMAKVAFQCKYCHQGFDDESDIEQHKKDEHSVQIAEETESEFIPLDSEGGHQEKVRIRDCIEIVVKIPGIPSILLKSNQKPIQSSELRRKPVANNRSRPMESPVISVNAISGALPTRS